jgi:hypothetical protein
MINFLYFQFIVNLHRQDGPFGPFMAPFLIDAQMAIFKQHELFFSLFSCIINLSSFQSNLLPLLKKLK